LKNFLQNGLHWPEPVILRDQPSHGKTIIEKFEDYAKTVDLAFVLLTPDDVAVHSSASNDEKRRARQNVIFELGYFYALFRRTRGRVVLLHCGPLELPSDLAGVIYIDGSSGIDAAAEFLRRELATWIRNRNSPR
jgi:predicted nucleotide-binding protein